MHMRTATMADLEQVLRWAAAEGWNPGLDDAAAFLAADPDGFFVTEVDGAPVAAISVVNHSSEFAFLGLYLCLPDYRGRGIGFSLWKHALEHAGARAVGLDGVADQEGNYAKSGFVKTGSSVRWEGQMGAQRDGAIRLSEPRDLPVISALDTSANGVARPALLTAWARHLETRKTVVLQGAEGVCGFATIRRCGEGVKVGPIVAPEASGAVALAQGALAVMPSDRVIIDVPSENEALTETLKSAGFESSFATARMWRGAAPQGDGTLAAIATMELG